MFYLFSDLRGFAIQANDDMKGSVDDIYFDGDSWTIRYVVAVIGLIFSGRKVLIGRELLKQPEMSHRAWHVELTKAEIESTPEPGPMTAEPVSAREERKMSRKIAQWPAILLGPEGAAYTPILAEQQLGEISRSQWKKERAPEPETHLRSMAEVRGYKVRARDDWIGTVDDFLIDPLTWRVCYVVVDTGDWLAGKRVVLFVDWLSDIDWSRGEVSAELTRHQVETSPPIDSVSGLKRSDADALLAHYGGPL